MIPFKDKNFEAYCSGLFFTSYYNSPGEDLAKLAALGDPYELAAFQEYGINLGELLK